MKTFFIILAILYLSFLIYMIVLHGFRKTWGVIRYTLVYIVLIPAQILSLLFPISWVLRGLGKWSLIFWLVMDDGRFDKTKTKQNGYANDYWVYIKARGKIRETFLIALEWHVRRNRIYNLLELFAVPQTDFKVGNNDIHSVEFVIDKLYKNNKRKTKVKQDGLWVASAGLKYIPKDKNDDPWQVNQGDTISIKTSILGTGFIWYYVGRWLSFRYSQCRVVKYPFIKPYYRTLKFGTNAKRYTFTIKHQQIKNWK